MSWTSITLENLINIRGEREKKKTKNEEKYLRFFFLKYVGKRGK